MTMTMNHSANGGTRRNLGSQIDRLDRILDGLDEALQGAITDAVKEAVSVAVAEAVRSTVLEIVSNPHILQVLRGQFTPAAPAPAPAASNSDRRPGPLKRALARVRGTVNKLTNRVRAAGNTARRTWQQANAIWALKRPIVVALGFGAVAGVVAYASSPWLAGVVSGLSATGAALGMQLAMFARRIFGGLPAH